MIPVFEDALLGDVDSEYVVASQIAFNLKSEFDAIENYDKLITFFQEKNDTESIDKIREIISDEYNHAEVLREIIKKYDNNIPTNET